MKIENKMYNTRQAAELLGVSKRTIDNYIYASQIKTVRRGRYHYIDCDELQAFIERGLTADYRQKLQAYLDEKRAERKAQEGKKEG